MARTDAFSVYDRHIETFSRYHADIVRNQMRIMLQLRRLRLLLLLSAFGHKTRLFAVIIRRYESIGFVHDGISSDLENAA